MHDFAYHRPTSVPEAATLMVRTEEAKLLAGGMTLLPTMKQRLASPPALIDLSRIAEMKGIREEAGHLVIGAMTTHAEIAESPLVRQLVPVLADMAEHIGDAQVRNRGTIGGSIANADPAADYPAAVLGLGATVVTSVRQYPGGQFFKGMFETALDGRELITAVRFPPVSMASWQKFRNPASRYAIVGVLVARTAGGIRVAVTGAGSHAFRWTAAEEALAAQFAEAALEPLTMSADDLNSDIHASAEYRAHLIKVMTRRAVRELG